MSLILGIDPGVSGAIALYDPDTGECFLHDTPTINVKVGKRNTNRISSALLAELVRGYMPDIRCAVIERVSAMPGQGVSSMFAFGYAAGQAEAVVSTLGLPVFFVTPQSWKKTAKIAGQPKDAARMKAIELIPGSMYDLTLKKHCGRADALLIAWSHNVLTGNTQVG